MENQEPIKSKVLIVYNEKEQLVIGRYNLDNQEAICKVECVLQDKEIQFKPKWYLKIDKAQQSIEKFSASNDMSNFEIYTLEFYDKPSTETVRKALQEFFSKSE